MNVSCRARHAIRAEAVRPNQGESRPKKGNDSEVCMAWKLLLPDPGVEGLLFETHVDTPEDGRIQCM